MVTVKMVPGGAWHVSVMMLPCVPMNLSRAYKGSVKESREVLGQTELGAEREGVRTSRSPCYNLHRVLG